MHVGSNNVKSKTDAIFFPASLKEAKALTANGSLTPNLIFLATSIYNFLTVLSTSAL
jgi:hypothetical protein